MARRFLTDVPALPEELRESIAQHMAFVHQAATNASTKWVWRMLDGGPLAAAPRCPPFSRS